MEDMIGSKGLIKRVDALQVLIQGLQTLGLSKTLNTLIQESGVTQQDFPSLKKYVLAGEWDKGLSLICDFVKDESTRKRASILILECKFFELLVEKKYIAALDILRKHLSPILGDDHRRLRVLTSYIVPGEELKLESTCQVYDRLNRLLGQENWSFLSLLESAYLARLTTKQRLHIPYKTIRVLREFTPILFLKFSHNGKYLASTADRKLIIWEIINLNGGGSVSIFKKHVLTGHETPISYVSWCADDSKVSSCAEGETVREWDVCKGICLSINTDDEPDQVYVSCGWFGNKMIFGSANEKDWTYLGRGADMETFSNKATISISLDDPKAICIDDHITKVEKLLLSDEEVSSIALSENKQYLVAALLSGEMNLWNISGDNPILEKTYTGGKDLGRCTFGGTEIACASYNSQIYIWNGTSGELIVKLNGHEKGVTAVSWNPENHGILASSSYDGTIRLWASDEVDWI